MLIEDETSKEKESGSKIRPQINRGGSRQGASSATGLKTSAKEGGKVATKEVVKKGIEKGVKSGVKAGATVAGGVASGGVSLVVQGATEGIKKVFDQANNMFEKRSADKDYGLKAIKWLLLLFFPLILIIIFSTIIGFGMASGVQNYTQTQFSGTRYNREYIISFQEIFVSKMLETFSLEGEVFEDKMEDYEIMQPYAESLLKNKRIIEFTLKKAKKLSKKDTEEVVRQCGYDYTITMESYSNNGDPYKSLRPPEMEPKSNVNFAEFLIVLSQSPDFSLTENTFQDIIDFFKIEENIRYLYNLTIEGKYLLDESGNKVLKEDYYSPETLEEMGKTIVLDSIPEGMDSKYVMYGEVTLEKYCLKQLYDMLSINAEDTNKDFYKIVNYDFLDYQEVLMRVYKNDVDLGSLERTSFTTDAYYNNTTIKNIEIITSDLSSMPQFFQGNYPNDKFGSSTIAKSGCGPTSLAMITSFFTGHNVSPVTIASEFERYYIPGAGMSHAMPSAVATQYGYQCIANGVGVNTQTIISQLSQGNPVMVRFKSGKFTGGGHLAAICGVTSDGKFIMRDPNSSNYKKYGSNYIIEDIRKEATKMWIFSR